MTKGRRSDPGFSPLDIENFYNFVDIIHAHAIKARARVICYSLSQVFNIAGKPRIGGGGRPSNILLPGLSLTLRTIPNEEKT